MLFRIPCVNNPPKDIPGLVCLTSYPNEDGQSVLLGMPLEFQIEEIQGGAELVSIEFSGQCGRTLLADNVVIGL